MSEDIKSTLQAEINAIQGQLEHFKAELQRVENSVPMDMSAYYQFQSEVGTAEAKLADKLLELKILDQASNAALEQVTSQFDNITVDGISFRLDELVKNDPELPNIHLNFMQAWLQSFAAGLAEQLTAKATSDIQAMKLSYENEISDLQEKIAELEPLKDKNYELENLLADAESKRDAAANELAEAQQDIYQLRADIKELRDNVNKPVAPVQTNVSANLSELARKLNESKPAIYNVRYADTLGRKMTAVLAKTGEPIEFGFLDKGLYREVSEAEAFQFRQSVEAEPSEAQSVEEVAVPSVPLDDLAFPSYEEATTDVDGLDQADAGSQVAGKTLEERIEALEVWCFGKPSA